MACAYCGADILTGCRNERGRPFNPKSIVTLRNVSATTTINRNPDYSRVRSFGDVTLTRAEFRQILRARNAGRTDEADALIGDKLAESRRLVGAPGIASVEISDVESGEIE